MKVKSSGLRCEGSEGEYVKVSGSNARTVNELEYTVGAADEGVAAYVPLNLL